MKLKLYMVTVYHGTTTSKVPVLARSSDESFDQAVNTVGIDYRKVERMESIQVKRVEVRP